MERLLYRHEIGGIHRICHHPAHREGDAPCYNCPSRAKCNAAIYTKLADYEELGYTPEELSVLIETYVPDYKRDSKKKENRLINKVYDKVNNMTQEQMLDLVFEQYDEYCNVCSMRARCSGMSHGPSGPIFPPCSDGFGQRILDRAALYNETAEILMEQEEE